jgi:YD repeat-containing protein
MKNIQGNKKSLTLKDEKGRVVYEFTAYGDGRFTEKASDKFGRTLTYKNSDGFIYTSDKFGNVLTLKDPAEGLSYKYTRDKFGNVLTFKDSTGFSYKYTRDKFGNVLTFQDPKGVITNYQNNK